MTACNCTGICKIFPYTCSGNWPQTITLPTSIFDRLDKLEKYVEDRKNMPTVDCGELNKLIYNGAETHASILKLNAKMKELEKFMSVKIEKLIENDSCIYWGYKEEKVKTNPPENIFDYVKCDQKGIDDMRHIKNVMYDLYCWILDNVEDNKYRSNGIDLLEAAVMQLNKAISRRKDNGTQKA